ncbi:TspO/MBR family protein [Mucilaginibacter myungsuensis]|uniref:Tryptophan-rich sensory protein n=1 Tax=Mucilaginibacter myungsuensis TaxID=649104 RepID=A0A929PVH6_9SPHI|nr:TspO/MBR family protein [Mucilaginibacter myungsuensis]MBE9661788.1 tryptophan-rich sensory protein [Mucilaginibacter myungsuensis]MDN3599778.1 TspO/MBR family protein [Mucilaginibacter myungsuensis]
MKATLQQSKFQFVPFILSILITLAIGFVASKFTTPEIPTWYTTIQKPSFNPPNWLFGPVWTLLYIMIAISAYLVWKRRDGSELYSTARSVYIIQLALNFSWSIVFFGMHQILGALVVIVLLWVSIVATMYYFNKFSKVACWMLLPYLLWVSFATALNTAIYLLNR